jgi:1-acyl-sn-glycerol-3-phosphate acyltransferase
MSEPYVPDLGLVYPEQPDGRMVEFKVVHDIKLDDDYPYLDKSFKFRIKRFLVYFVLFTVGLFITAARAGLKREGKKNLKKYRHILKNGALTVCNHVHRWDFIMITQTFLKPMFFPVWKEQLKSPDAGLIRYAGGIPVPDEIHQIKFFNKAFDEIAAKKIWIHAFPESSRFDFYQPIRPFKKGVFTMAHRYNLPVIPMAYSYRKPRFPFTILNAIRPLMGRQKKPMLTLRIGEPLFIDTTLPRKEAVAKLRKECHEAVVRLAGITDNKYPAEGD